MESHRITEKEQRLVDKGDIFKVVVKDPHCPSRYFRHYTMAMRFAQGTHPTGPGLHPLVLGAFRAISGDWIRIKEEK